VKILLSAYACAPDEGSEPAVGWNWATTLGRHGHEVHVITRANNRDAIEAEYRTNPQSGLKFLYYDLPHWARWWKKGQRGIHLYYILWQLGAYLRARHLVRNVKFDYVHHITLGVFRHPSFMAFLGIPFIFGPVGGGERAPLRLRASFPWRGKLLDFLRDIANLIARFDPLLRTCLKRSRLILCKTSQTAQLIPRAYADRVRVRLEIGTAIVSVAPVPIVPAGDLRVLYIGRLIYWKGVHFALRAFAEFRRHHPLTSLTIVGNGGEREWAHRLADHLSLNDAVRWLDWIPHDEVPQLYKSHDVLLFPSLHDSSGNVVLEALSQSLPVVCLDLGGPAEIVTQGCGRVIVTKRREEPEVVTDLALALAELAEDSALLANLREGAVQRAREFSWGSVVSAVYGANSRSGYEMDAAALN